MLNNWLNDTKLAPVLF